MKIGSVEVSCLANRLCLPHCTKSLLAGVWVRALTRGSEYQRHINTGTCELKLVVYF